MSGRWIKDLRDDWFEGYFVPIATPTGLKLEVGFVCLENENKQF